MHRAELLRKTAIIIVNVASMLDQKVSEMVDIVLKDLRWFSRVHLRRRFGGICIVVAGDFWQLLSVVPSRHLREDADETRRYVNVRLLYELAWASRL